MGLEMRYPHRRHFYRTTAWKNTGIRVRDGVMLLARARGLEPIRVALPDNLQGLPASAYKHVEFVWDRAGRRYHSHVTLEDAWEPAPAPAPGNPSPPLDLPSIHPPP